MLARLSLRTRLVLGVIVLAAVGLAAADVATYTSLSSFLIHRTDSTLDAAHLGVEHALFQHGPGPDSGRGGSIDALTAAAPGAYIQVRKLDGSVVAAGAIPQFSQQKTPPPPRLPATIALPRRGLGRRRPRPLLHRLGAERRRAATACAPRSSRRRAPTS